MRHEESFEQKDYLLWHSQKREIQLKSSRVYFEIREIWFCYLGENIGHEQDGRGKEFLRPVVVLRKFNQEIFWAIPLTTTAKDAGHPYYFAFSFRRAMTSVAILSQIRLLDVKRLKYKIGTITKQDFLSLKQKIRQLFV